MRPRSVVALARRLGSPLSNYARFVDRVEPQLMIRPRVHRFGAVPDLGEPDLPAEEMAVCVDPAGGGDPARTAVSIERGSRAPVAVIEGSLSHALAATRADWILLVRAGDALAERALERLGQAVALAPDARIISADDDLESPEGRRHSPRLRPGPSPDLWRSRDPALTIMAVRRRAVEPGTGSRSRLLLELGGANGAGHAHVPLVLCHAGQRATPEAPSGEHQSGHVHPGEPAVEVIVPFRDRPDLLERSARSLLERTAYERLSLRLVDNGSEDPRTGELLARLAQDRRVCVDRDARAFNFSSLGNAAAVRSSADVLVFVNNDTETVDERWIGRLLSEAMRPEVGAVAPLLTFPDGRVQHAGVAIGLHGWAGHPFAGLAPDEDTPFGRATDGPRNWLAVSAACMMIERRKFEEVGGFDERFQVGGGDVDLGLRLTAAGYRSLCVPAARMIHDESATRDPAAIPSGDFEASRRSYREFRTVGDPFYHPALTLRDTSCSLRSDRDEPLPP